MARQLVMACRVVTSVLHEEGLDHFLGQLPVRVRINKKYRLYILSVNILHTCMPHQGVVDCNAQT